MMHLHFKTLVFSCFFTQIITQTAFYRLIDTNTLTKEHCKSGDVFEFTAISQIECLLVCSKLNKHNVHFSNIFGDCSCLKKECFAAVFDGFTYQKVKNSCICNTLVQNWVQTILALGINFG